MVKFGTKTLPGTVLQIEERDKKIYEERPIPGKALSSRKQHGAFGEEYVVRGLVTENLVTERAELKALADGASRIFDLEDGSPQIYALMLDPFFRMEAGKLHYELAFAQTSMLASRALSDSPTISDVLKAIVGMSLSDTPSISETLKAFRGVLSDYGQSTVGSQSYPTVNLGNTNIEATNRGYGANYVVAATKFNVAGPRTLKQILLYFHTTPPSGNIKFAVYPDSGGSPASQNLIGQTSGYALPTSSGWKPWDLTTDRIHIPSSGDKWLCFLHSVALSAGYCYSKGSAYNEYYFSRAYADGFPATFPSSPSSYLAGDWSFYAKAILIKGFMIRAKRFTLTAEKPVFSVRIYSHVAVGNARVAIFDEQSPKNKKWEANSIALAAGWNEVLISQGTPSSLTLPAADYGVWCQYDDVADALSYTAGAAGDGRRKAQPYGPYPSTISDDESTSEIWTEVARVVTWEEV